MDNMQQHIERIREWAQIRGYSKVQIDQGIAYATQQGADRDSEIATLMMSRILFSDEQLRDGVRYNVTHILP